MKKFFSVFVIGLFVFTACASEKKGTEEKVYDSDFVETLAKALHDRWETNETANGSEAERLEKVTQIEIDEFSKKDFANKKFKDNKLKELAIAYINELDDGIKVTKESSAKSLISNWEEHYARRSKLLVEINEKKKIPLDNEDEKIFKELLNSGNEFKEQEAFDTKLNLLLQSFHFDQKPQEFESEWKEYEAVTENNTGSNIKSFSANVYLEDAAGTRVDTQYLNTQDWDSGQKVTFTFTTNKEFSKITVTKNFIELAK